MGIEKGKGNGCSESVWSFVWNNPRTKPICGELGFPYYAVIQFDGNLYVDFPYVDGFSVCLPVSIFNTMG